MSEDNHDWVNPMDDLPESFWEEVPKPLYWRVLVMPITAKEKTKSGIVIPVSAQESQKYLNYIGKVIAMGPTAGKHERLGGDGVNVSPGFPKIGDYIAYGQYAGQRMTFKGTKLLTLNDDEILHTVPNPDALTVHI